MLKKVSYTVPVEHDIWTALLFYYSVYECVSHKTTGSVVEKNEYQTYHR